MNFQRDFNPVRSLRFRLHSLSGFCGLAISRAKREGRVNAIGRPIIHVHPESEISLGDGVCLISASFATALGVNHPVVLRTLRAGARIRIGKGVGISGGSICAADSVLIDDETMLGANVTIGDTDFHSLHPRHRAGHAHATIGVQAITIGKRVLIGTNSIILKGVTIGDNSVIGAGSVVTSSVPPDSIAAGNPCRVLRTLSTRELTT